MLRDRVRLSPGLDFPFITIIYCAVRRLFFVLHTCTSTSSQYIIMHVHVHVHWPVPYLPGRDTTIFDWMD